MVEKQIPKESQNQVKTSIDKVIKKDEKDLKKVKENLSEVKTIDRWRDLKK